MLVFTVPKHDQKASCVTGQCELPGQGFWLVYVVTKYLWITPLNRFTSWVRQMHFAQPTLCSRARLAE